MEQAWADYCNILNHIPLTTAQGAIIATIIRSEVDRQAFDYITGLVDKYLYDPNYPLLNEEYYIPVLEAATACINRSLFILSTESNKPICAREVISITITPAFLYW